MVLMSLNSLTFKKVCMFKMKGTICQTDSFYTKYKSKNSKNSNIRIHIIVLEHKLWSTCPVTIVRILESWLQSPSVTNIDIAAEKRMRQYVVMCFALNKCSVHTSFSVVTELWTKHYQNLSNRIFYWVSVQMIPCTHYQKSLFEKWRSFLNTRTSNLQKGQKYVSRSVIQHV